MDDVTKTEKMLRRKEGRVGYVIFNNPERHNAVSLDMWAETSRILEDYARDDEVRVVVLTGAGGKAFVSGADISKFESERATMDHTRHYNQTVERAYARGRKTRRLAQRRRGDIELHEWRKQTKYQNPSLQVRVKSQDRVRIVQMASEKRPASETTQAISSPNK